MAKDTVEILGGQLDGAVLQNAASEATLRDLVAAISGKQSNTGAGSSVLGRTPAGMIAGGVVGAVSGAVKGAVNQIGNVTGAAGAFAGMMIKGEGRMSSYTKVLNNQVISQLPLVGRYLGAVGGAISGTIEEFERWNKTLQSLTGTGATFNNSIIQMMNASVRTYMSLDEFSAFVAKNNKTFVALGATVTEGATAFSDYSYEVLKAGGPARRTLIQMGYSVPQINAQLADYLEQNYRGTRADRIDKTQLANSFVVYQTYLHTLTSLTGKQADQLKTEMQSVQNDTAFKLKLNKLDEKEKKKINLALANYTALYGKEAAEVYKAIFLGLTPASKSSAYFAMMFPQAVDEMRNTLSIAQDGNTSVIAFQEYTVKERARLIQHSARQLDEFAPLLKAGSAGVDKVAEILGVSTDIASLIARKNIDVSKLSLEEIENIVREADEEVRKREELTEILRTFETAMGDFKVGFLDVMTKEGGPLHQFSEAMKGKDMPNKIREFGQLLGDFVANTLPQVAKMFARLFTDSGREMYKLSIQKMFDQIGAHLLYYLPKMIGMDGNEEILSQQLQNIDKSYDPRIATAEAKSDMEVARMVTKPSSQQAQPDFVGPARAGGNVFFDAHGATRNRPLSEKLNEALTKAAAAAGVDLRITSGGQMSIDEAKARGAVERSDGWYIGNRRVRTGSERHDGGNAADLDVYAGGTNTPLSITSPAYKNFLKAAKRYGISNFGAGDGYMETGGPGTRIHMGISGTPAKWGAGGKGENAHPVLSEFREGTLGSMGSLYANMGSGTTVEAHGEEAALSPAELAGEMVAAADYSSAGVNQLNQNFQELIMLIAKKNSLAEDISNKMARGSRNLVSSFG